MSFLSSKTTSYMLAICIAVIVILGAMLYSEASAAQTGRTTPGPYMLMQHSNPTAAAGVFRVNVNTGYVSYCYIDNGNKPGVSCTAETP
ncbi:MAG: hypothetical protein SFW65_07250 [Alphaproteobacteria bacterium]|nr:hypothetical protein [Alphaproteobacteria bacterium]